MADSGDESDEDGFYQGPRVGPIRESTGPNGFSGAEVYANVGDYLARSKAIELGPVLALIAEEVIELARGFAAPHMDTEHYIDSLGIAVDRGSPSGRDLFVFADDALGIEWDHVAHVGNGSHNVPRLVEGQHILGRAAAAARGAG